MRSAAGGETGAPRSQRGTRLKATTERAFLDPRRQCRLTEKACPSLPTVRNGLSLIRTKAAIDVVPKARLSRVASITADSHHAAALRARPQDRIGEQGRDDHTH